MKEWKYKPLNEVCNVINGLWKGKKPPFSNVGVIRNANFTKQLTLDFSNVEHIDVETRQLEKRTLNIGDIIVEKSGGSEKQPVGRVVVFYGGPEDKYSFSNFTSVLRIKEHSELNYEFLYWYLHYIYVNGDTKSMQKATTGIHNIEFEKFLNIQIPLPAVEYQRAIVSKINTEFAAIDQIKQNAANSLEEAKSLFCSTLEDAIRQRADWRKVKVSEIATDMYRGSGIKRDQVTKDGTPCVRYGEIYTSYNYSFSECISHTQESLISSKKYFEHGDILFAITGESVEDIGKCVAYTGTEKCLLGGDIIAMKHHENPKFLAYALSTKEAIKQKGKGKTKLKVVHTNYADLRDISINLPKDLSEQSSIAAKLDTVFNYVQQVENNCAEISKNCTELKQSILRNIFN